MGNRHLRRNTPSRPVGKVVRDPRKAGNAANQGAPVASVTSTATAVEVTREECEKLAGDLAYFNACTFRDASPGELRKDDIERAEKEILVITGRTP